MLHLGPGSDLGMVTLDGLVEIESLRVMKKSTFQHLITCPAVNNMEDAIITHHNYRCESGRGGYECGKNFGGFTEEQKKTLKENTYYTEDNSNDGAGECLAVWDVMHCHALTPATVIPEMKVLKYIFVQTEARAMAYASDRCPVYKEENGEWTVNKPLWMIDRVGFDKWIVKTSWEGKASGDNTTITNGIVEETVSEMLIKYQVEYENRTVVEVIGTERACACTLISCIYVRHLHSVTQGVYGGVVALGYSRDKCVATKRCKVKVENTGEEFIIDSRSALGKHTASIATGVVAGSAVLKSKNTVMCEIPKPGEERNYDHNYEKMEFGTKWDLGGVLNPFNTLQIGKIQNLLIYGVILMTIVMNPIILKTPMGIIMVGALFFMTQIQAARANYMFDLSSEDYKVLCICYGAGVSKNFQNVYFTWISWLIVCYGLYRNIKKQKEISVILHIVYVIVYHVNTHPMLRYVIWLPYLFQNNKWMTEKLNEIQYNTTESLHGVLMVTNPWNKIIRVKTFLGKQIQQHGAMLKRITSRLIIKDRSRAEVFMEKPRYIPEGKVLKMRNLRGCIFFTQEYGIVSELLRELGPVVWQEMADEAPMITGREPFELEWMKRWTTKYKEVMK